MFDKKYKRALAIIKNKIDHYTFLRDVSEGQARCCPNEVMQETYMKWAKDFDDRRIDGRYRTWH